MTTAARALVSSVPMSPACLCSTTVSRSWGISFAIRSKVSLLMAKLLLQSLNQAKQIVGQNALALAVGEQRFYALELRLVSAQVALNPVAVCLWNSSLRQTRHRVVHAAQHDPPIGQ